MTTRRVKLAITNADIPVLYQNVSRATIDNQDAQARLPASYSGDPVNADYGTAQLIYAENVLPFAKGLYSVGYAQQTPAAPGPVTTCDQYIPLRDVNENIRGFIPAKGANFVYNDVTAAWTSTNSFSFLGTLVTRAYVQGRTFICYEKNRIIEYNVGTGLFTTISLTYPAGVSIANVRGIGSAQNYLLFFTDLGIYWSTLGNVLDFATTDQGAGTQTPTDIKGQITAILNVSGGFIVYSARNAVSATYTNNAAAPFSFKEVANCGGVSSWERVTPESDINGHYAWTTNGLQQVNLNIATNVFPEATDFLVGGIMESWDAVNKIVAATEVGTAFTVKLAFLSGRFLAISYGAGTTSFSHALIYDTALKRWGKVKITHTDCFMFAYTSGTGAYTYDTLPGTYDALVGDYAALGLFFLAVTAPKQGMAFLQADGKIYVLVSNQTHSGDTGVAVFGRIAQSHGRKTTMQEVTLDGVKGTPAPVVTLLSGVDGYKRDTVNAMTLLESSNNFYRYAKRITADNHDVAIEGTFAISSALALVSQHGSR
jgi:hypothetical protein